MKRHDVSPALRKFLKVCLRSANGLWGKRWMEVAVMISAGGVEILKKNVSMRLYSYRFEVVSHID